MQLLPRIEWLPDNEAHCLPLWHRHNAPGAHRKEGDGEAEFSVGPPLQRRHVEEVVVEELLVDAEAGDQQRLLLDSQADEARLPGAEHHVALPDWLVLRQLRLTTGAEHDRAVGSEGFEERGPRHLPHAPQEGHLLEAGDAEDDGCHQRDGADLREELRPRGGVREPGEERGHDAVRLQQREGDTVRGEMGMEGGAETGEEVGRQANTSKGSTQYRKGMQWLMVGNTPAGLW